MSDAVAPYLYPLCLLLFSVVVSAAEALWPWRKNQKQVRPFLWSDLLHLVFNGHFLGVILFGVATHYVLPPLDDALKSAGLYTLVYRGAAAEWPVALQIVVALVVVDFLQWCVHNLLHRVPFLWDFHKVHHSIVDGEMDWLVSFRFQWTEVIVYRSVLYLPLAYFGFGYTAIMTHAIFGTLIGHLNHANLKLSYGPLRYLLNSPRMHIWHHDYEGDTKTTVNFGIIFSCWDWIFRTAKMPDQPPAKLGFRGVEAFPRNFFAHMGWPFVGRSSVAVATATGVLALVGGFALSQASHNASATPMLGEVAASSQPSRAKDFDYPIDAAQAGVARAEFGRAAQSHGFAVPAAMVSVDELAAALGAKDLVIVDVRPKERFTQGHIPSALRIGRGHYAVSEPIPGFTRTAAELQQLLANLGITEADEVVLYADGGPEPYRLWWSLRERLGRTTRVLDGGLAEWKAQGHGLAEGARLPVAVPVSPAAPNTRPAPGDEASAPGHWAAERERITTWSIIDTRSRDEFTGRERHKKAKRQGHMPKAKHFEWTRVFESEKHPVLKRPARLRTELSTAGIGDGPVVTMCQSGTRSSAVYYAMLQAGRDARNLLNYDGSWAEYSRLDEPLCDCSDVVPVTTHDSAPPKAITNHGDAPRPSGQTDQRSTTR